MCTYNISREGGGGLDDPFAEFRRIYGRLRYGRQVGKTARRK